ncbi:MAG: hypothetical protein ACP5IO_06095 [Elusimicrobiales bacterium]
MKKFLIALLIFAAGIIASFLVAHEKDKKYDDVYYWDRLLKRHIEETKKMEKEIFDSIFNDKFFSKDYDPFMEIENFRKRMKKMLEAVDYDIFSNSFNRWFDERIINPNSHLTDIKLMTSENDEIYTVEIENTEPKNLNISIDIKPDHIKITSQRMVENEKEQKNIKSYQSSYFKYIRYFSLPPHIRGKDYSIENSPNKIIIKFKKK